MVSTNNADDPAYWESTFTLLGIYDNYKFLFMESSMSVETKNWVTPGNISPSLKWDAIAKKSFETVLDHYVKDVFIGQIRSTLNALSTFFGMFDAPLAVAYGSSEGYIKGEVSGDLYMRTIYIQDKLDRMPGYAYYQWGTTEQLKATLAIKAKWPTSVRPGGTYNYAIEWDSFNQQTSQTPGFFGNSSLYRSIISLYKNELGYFPHNERIDFMSIIAKLLG